MPPERNNTIRFTQLSALSLAGPNDVIPIVDTSIPTLVNKKITITGLNQSLPVSLDMANIKSVSSNWDSVYASFNSNSAEYESTFSNIISNSSNWDSVYTSVNQNSAGWTGLTTYSTVRSLSDTWNTAYSLASSAYTTLSALSSGTWVLKGGDQMTGALTTTRTNTASFGLDEFVTKRYADALATASQISGNFVPGLYYTKNDFQTGVVSVLSAVNLQTYGFALGTSGGSQTGTLTFNPNLYGTSVTGFTLNSTNNRSGLKVICGTYAQFNVSEQGISWVWGGPTFQQSIFNLGDSSGNSIFTVDHYGQFHPAPLTNTAVVRCTLGTNLLVRDYNTVTVAPRWNNVATTFAGLTLSAVDVASATGSNLLDLQTNGVSQLRVRKDGVMQSSNSIYDAAKVSGLANVNSSGTLLTFLNPFDGTIGIAPAAMVQWGRPGDGTPFNNQGDVLVTRDEAGVLCLRPNTVNAGPQAIRIYRQYVNNTTNFERFGLSGNRLAYELSGSARFYIEPTATNDQIIVSTGNLTLSAAGSLQFSQSLPFYFSSLSASKLTFDRTSPTISNPHITYPFNDNIDIIADTAAYNSIGYGSGPSFKFTVYGSVRGGYLHRVNGNFNGGQYLTRDQGLFWLNTTGFSENSDLFLFRDAPWVLAIRDSVTQTGTNALRIYNNYTDSSNYSRLSLSGDRIEFERAGTGTGGFDSSMRKGTYGGIGWFQANTWVGQFPGQEGHFHLSSIKEFRWGFGEQTWNYDLSLARDTSDTLALRRSTNPNCFRIYNTYTDANNYERLSLSATRIAYEAAGTGVSRDLTISTTGNLILSGSGIFLNTPTPFSFGTAQLSAYRLQLIRDPSSGFLGYIDTPFDGTIIRLGGAWNVTTNNFAANDFGRGQINFPGVVNTPNSFAINNQIYLYKDASLATNLITLSSNSSQVGFSFTSKSPQNGRCVIYNDGDNLNLAAYSGAGKRIRFCDWDYSTGLAGGLFGEVSYSGWQMINMNLTNFAGYLTTDTLKINQLPNQTGSYLKVLSSDTVSTVFEITSANNVFVRNQINFQNKLSTGPAIKGTSTTVQARTGDDSQYTYLQGKLQTDQAASAGTFTPDKYIILYDSTGTAYKVPVQAL